MFGINSNLSSRDVGFCLAPVALGAAILTARATYSLWLGNWKQSDFTNPGPDLFLKDWSHGAGLATRVIFIGGIGAALGGTMAVFSGQNPEKETLKTFGIVAGTVLALAHDTTCSRDRISLLTSFRL